MSASCKRTPLAHTSVCQVELCSCGVVHVAIGVLTLRSGESSIRFRPPLDITGEVIDEAMDAMRKYCQKQK